MRVVNAGACSGEPLSYRPSARQPQMIETSMPHLGFRCIVRDARQGDRSSGISELPIREPNASMFPSLPPLPDENDLAEILDLFEEHVYAGEITA